MASLRDIRTRIGSVKNTQQVTRAMKMVAAAKLRKAQEGIFAARPYAYKIGEMISHLKGKVDPSLHELFQTRESVEHVLLVVVTADRGLAGAFNSNVIKLTEQAVAEYGQDRVKLLCIGRKGYEHFKKRGLDIVGYHTGMFDSLSIGFAREVIETAVEGYRDGQWDEVKLVYNEFRNTISQNRIAEPILPIPAERFVTPVMEQTLDQKPGELPEAVDYIFEPGPAAILDILVPRFLVYQLWRALLESSASEHGARMVAMDNATTNADDLLRELKLKYNRARQDAITTELNEIVGGANALEQA